MMSLRTWILLTVLSIVWGGSFFFVEVALEAFPPFTIVFLRVALAAIALLLVLAIQRKRLPRDMRLWISYAVMGLLNNAIPFSLIVWGQTQITGGVAAILNAITPVFTIFVAHLFTKDEKISTRKIIGALCGLLGVYILMRPTLAGGFSLENLGQVAILGAAMSYAFAAVWGKRMRMTTPIVNATGMLICSAVIMLPIVLLPGGPTIATPSLLQIGSVAALAIVSTALAYIFYFRILAEAGATNLLLVTLLIPVSAMLLGCLILGESVSLAELSGMFVIFASLGIADGRLLMMLSRATAGKPAH